MILVVIEMRISKKLTKQKIFNWIITLSFNFFFFFFGMVVVDRWWCVCVRAEDKTWSDFYWGCFLNMLLIEGLVNIYLKKWIFHNIKSTNLIAFNNQRVVSQKKKIIIIIINASSTTTGIAYRWTMHSSRKCTTKL